MTDAAWTDRIVGDRMAVDREFQDRVAGSQFSSQEWGLIMTAVDLRIEAPGDPSAAHIVADTSKLPHVMPEMENLQQQMDPMAGSDSDGGGSGGFLDSIRRSLGFDAADEGGVDEDRMAAAEALSQEYADELQRHLENNGKWDEVRTAAGEGDGGE